MEFTPPARLIRHLPFASPSSTHHGLPHGLEARFSLNLLTSSSYDALTLSVPLDHSNPNDRRRHTIRYWVDDEYWSGRLDAPILLNVPGESAQSGPAPLPPWLRSRGGLALSLEHRFFGASVPTSDTAVANLRFLTVEQSLSDLVALVTHVKAERRLTGAVIAYGCSYPGALGAWLRTRHPQAVAAAVAASAPVEARVRFNGLDRSVGLALHRHSPRCLRKVQEAMERLDAPGSMRRVKEILSMASDAALPQGDFDLRYMLADTVANAVQTGNKASLCSRLEGMEPLSLSAEQVAEKWAEAAGIGGDRSFQQAYDSELLRDTAINSTVKDNRLWTWLQCAQLGYLQATNAVDPDLPSNMTARSKRLTVDAFLANCEYLFPGAELHAAKTADEFNAKFGGAALAAPGLSNILYLKYADDPWWALQPSHATPSVQVSLAADTHCAHCGMGCSEDFMSTTEAALQRFVFSVNSTVRLTSAAEVGSAQPAAGALQPAV